MWTTGKPVVLVVDDDRATCEMVKMTFTKEGYRVVTATNFNKAVRLVHENESKPMVTFVDINLPGPRNGINLLAYLNQYSPHVASYAWTGDSSKEVKKEAVWAGAIHTFTKPLDMEDLVIYLKSLVVRKLIYPNIYDNLTELLNRRTFSAFVEAALDRARYNLPAAFSLLFIDADHFKEINDTNGHQVGDEALKVIAGIIRSHVRMSDHPCRYGGDEFLVWLPGLYKDGAFGVGKKIQDEIATTAIITDSQQKVPLSISFGVAGVGKGEPDANAPKTLEELIRRADEAMYQAKRAKVR